MRLALIYPPFCHKAFNENLRTVDEEFGVFPYLGFGWVAGEARAAGWEVRLFDAAMGGASYAETLELVRAWDPDLLGFAAHAVQTFHDMLGWARRFKDDTGLPILAGGYEAAHYPREIMSHGCLDYLCLGGVKPFLGEFLRAFERQAGHESVRGLAFRHAGEPRFNPRAEDVPFDRMPPPDRGIFDNTRYWSHVSQRRNFTVGMSSVGCPYGCDFCCMRATGFTARPATAVFAEMEECVRRHGIREIDWFDPVMLHDKKRIDELADLLIGSGLDITWSTRTRVEPMLTSRRGGAVDEAFIARLAESGCRRLFIGVESANEDILRGLHKGLDVTPVRDVFACLRDHGIMVLGFFMIGSPGETRATAEQTIAYARSLPLAYAQFSMTTMKPHTRLAAKHMEPSLGMDYWREYVLGNVEERPLPAPWTDLSRDEIEELTKQAYLGFYFRPEYVMGMLRKVRSPEELAKYVRVALQMALRPAAFGLSARPSRNRALRPFRAAFEAGLALARSILRPSAPPS